MRVLYKKSFLEEIEKEVQLYLNTKKADIYPIFQNWAFTRESSRDFINNLFWLFSAEKLKEIGFFLNKEIEEIAKNLIFFSLKKGTLRSLEDLLKTLGSPFRIEKSIGNLKIIFDLRDFLGFESDMPESKEKTYRDFLRDFVPLFIHIIIGYFVFLKNSKDFFFEGYLKTTIKTRIGGVL